MAHDTERDDATPTGPTPRRRRLVLIGLLIGTGVVLVDAIAGDRGLFVLLRAREEGRTRAASVESLRRENQRLSEQASRFRDDPASIEDLARRDLGMIKPGEKLFIIRDLPAAPAK